MLTFKIKRENFMKLTIFSHYNSYILENVRIEKKLYFYNNSLTEQTTKYKF